MARSVVDCGWPGLRLGGVEDPGAAGFVGGGELASADTDVDGKLRVVILCTKPMERKCG